LCKAFCCARSLQQGNRGPQAAALIHHSDRGVQYASIAYRQISADRDITISMSSPGDLFDSAKDTITRRASRGVTEIIVSCLRGQSSRRERRWVWVLAFRGRATTAT
jgi:hypothetical protein